MILPLKGIPHNEAVLDYFPVSSIEISAAEMSNVWKWAVISDALQRRRAH
ncbi:MAG: hypothetical protein AAFZ17_19155 [Cyanobacteria bacterium J06650_10]